MGGPTRYQIAVDVGGTFTDLVVLGRDIPGLQAKALTTPEDPTDGVFAVLARAAAAFNTDLTGLLRQCRLLLLGTTFATNAMVQLNGARVGQICTEGFRDDIAIRRGRIPPTQDFRMPLPPDLVPRHRRVGVRERIRKDGAVEVPLSEADVVGAVADFRRDGVESVAVTLFNSYLNPVHEQQVRAIVAREMPGTYVSTSTDVLPVMGEYPRFSTTVVNAYVAPCTISRLEALAARLKEAGFGGDLLIVQNNGGVIDVATARRRPVLMVLSGPAAGAPAARAMAESSSTRDLILFDMGGTSTDITVLRDDLPLLADEININGYHVMLPAVDVHTVAAGGGAIASIDAGGLLRVGPASAGARPGPACLNRGGTRPTVTDANLALGRLDPATYANGEIPLYPDRARAALAVLGEQLGLTPEQTALGVVQVAEHIMTSAIKVHCLRKGVDPRKFALVSAGGAGGIHAAAMARLLGCRRVYFPQTAAVFCAMGMHRADLRRDYMASFFKDLDQTNGADLTEAFRQLKTQAAVDLRSSPWPARRLRYVYTCAMQYRGQAYQLDVPASEVITDVDLPGLKETYHRTREERYGHRDDQALVQIVRVRLTVVGELDQYAFTPPQDAATGGKATQRCVTFSSGECLDVPLRSLASIAIGQALEGPLVVEGDATTMLIPPGATVRRESSGGLVMDLQESASHG